MSESILVSPPRDKRRGLVIVNTGDGKGKTTAALGTALRAVGYGWHVLILQFIKGTWKYGEMEAIKRLEPEVELVRMGKGFYKILNDNLPEEVHKEAAREALAFAREQMHSGKYDLIILDEINVALQTGLLDVKDVLTLLDERPAGLHLILTGRGAPPEIVERADMVTEMREVKHPYQQGIKAQRGIDY
ncbi:MAG: cob(I)yrinic acid a,c-diamide adenosyltransferase [Chloroflexi bacterium RBG_16_57_9]|nr:MAG: cob(I)yrinic acid a,c-diamide adenosyltransferase [Chloroflexi bacterium RBG_16_57_9]